MMPPGSHRDPMAHRWLTWIKAGPDHWAKRALRHKVSGSKSL